MGVWGIGVFENDDASDWVYDLEKWRKLWNQLWSNSYSKKTNDNRRDKKMQNCHSRKDDIGIFTASVNDWEI